MGLHDQITLSNAEPTAFVWPALPRVTAAELAMAQALPSTRHRVALALPGNVEAQLEGPVAPTAVSNAVRVAVTYQDQPVLIEASEVFVDALLKATGKTFQIRSLEEATAILVLEHVLGMPLTALEGSLKTAFSLQTPTPDVLEPREDTARLGLEIRLPDARPHQIIVQGTPDNVATLVAHLTKAPQVSRPPRRFTALSFAASLRTETLEVSADDHAALDVGDALMLPSEWSDLKPAWTLVAGALRAPVLAGRDGSITLRKSFEPLVETLQKDVAMATPQPNATPRAPARPEAPATDGLPVDISLELDTTQISLNELNRLTAGAVLPFSKDLPKTVRLIANGAPFAEGELVQLDEQVGVRLTARL